MEFLVGKVEREEGNLRNLRNLNTLITECSSMSFSSSNCIFYSFHVMSWNSTWRSGPTTLWYRDADTNSGMKVTPWGLIYSLTIKQSFYLFCRVQNKSLQTCTVPLCLLLVRPISKPVCVVCEQRDINVCVCFSIIRLYCDVCGVSQKRPSTRSRSSTI